MHFAAVFDDLQWFVTTVTTSPGGFQNPLCLRTYTINIYVVTLVI
jgi:hypothetical protein